jgi:alkylation response protein AidB-like acyl-CoA dehydrogenase
MNPYRLSPAQSAILEKARSHAEASVAPHAAAVDADSRFPRESMEALAEGGFYGLHLPEEFGGLGQSPRVAAAVVETLAQHCASTAMVYMMHLAGTSCYLTAPKRFAAELRDAAAGRHLATLAFSEKGSRSQFWAPVSRLAQSANGLTLSAEKSWVTSAGLADGIVVSCLNAAGTGPSVFLVKRNDRGLSIDGTWNSLGMRGNQSAPMRLDQVPLDPESRLIGDDGHGDAVMLGRALPIFQICQGAIGIGIAEAAFAATRDHLTASRFSHLDSRLADLPNLRAQLAEMRFRIDQARAYLASTLDLVEAGDPGAMPHVLAVKAVSGEMAVAVTDLAMRSCGGAAFSKHLGVERPFRDARAAIVMAPTTDHIKEFVGRLLVGLPLFA